MAGMIINFQNMPNNYFKNSYKSIRNFLFNPLSSTASSNLLLFCLILFYFLLFFFQLNFLYILIYDFLVGLLNWYLLFIFGCVLIISIPFYLPFKRRILFHFLSSDFILYKLQIFFIFSPLFYKLIF